MGLSALLAKKILPVDADQTVGGTARDPQQADRQPCPSDCSCHRFPCDTIVGEEELGRPAPCQPATLFRTLDLERDRRALLF